MVAKIDNIIMVNCWAVGCSNRSEHGLKVHSFPKDAVRRAQWMHNANRIDPSSNPRAPKLLEPSHSKICEVRMLAVLHKQ